MMLTATPMSRPLCAAAQLAAPRLLSSGVSERVTHLKRYDWKLVQGDSAGPAERLASVETSSERSARSTPGLPRAGPLAEH
jgi:hypothetical protein